MAAESTEDVKEATEALAKLNVSTNDTTDASEQEKKQDIKEDEKVDSDTGYEYGELNESTLLLVKALHRELFKGVDYEDLLDADLLSGETKSLLLFPKNLKTNTIDFSTLAGIITYKIEERKVRDPKVLDTWTIRYVAYIMTLGIQKNHRRKGLARKM